MIEISLKVNVILLAVNGILLVVIGILFCIWKFMKRLLQSQLFSCFDLRGEAIPRVGNTPMSFMGAASPVFQLKLMLYLLYSCLFAQNYTITDENSCLRKLHSRLSWCHVLKLILRTIHINFYQLATTDAFRPHQFLM